MENTLSMRHGRIINIPKSPRQIYDEALVASYNMWIDEKGTKANPGVWQRKLSSLTYDEAFKIIEKNKPHWTIFYRSSLNSNEKDYWEFGACNIGSNEYGDVFIWIQVDIKQAEKIFEKHQLKIDWY